ncbi:MAG: hypothetical protein FWE59_00590 [Oscillospiraceae bacterium]|nr:hypothetical protein [Oscillospiraceae bacterium]
MADSGKRFRFTPVGGFRRQDVITYIEKLMKEHHEEIDACRAGAEQLRRERDDARERAALGQIKVEELTLKSKQLPYMQSDVESLKSRLNQLAVEKTRQSETLQKLEGAREGDRTALSRLQSLLAERESKLQSLQKQIDDFIVSYASAEELERKAVERARAIETEALANAEHSRELITRLWMDTKDRYTAFCREAEEATAVAVQELDKVRALLIGASHMFDGVNSSLDELPLPEEEPFASAGAEPILPLSGEASSLLDMLAQQKQAQIDRQAPAAPAEDDGAAPGEYKEDKEDKEDL